jgi:hypothetical protein
MASFHNILLIVQISVNKFGFPKIKTSRSRKYCKFEPTLKTKAMKRFFVVASVLLSLFIFSCNQSGNSSYSAESEPAADISTKLDKMVQPDENVVNLERKLIKEGYVEFETRNIMETRENILTAVKKYKGYISSDQEFSEPGKISNTLVIRIPAPAFDSTLAFIGKDVRKFDRKEVFIRDVTEEFLDVEARLNTKRELEQRYIELLKQAGKISEIMEIERELAQLRGDVESIEGRYKYLTNQVAFSTLNITYYKTSPIYVSYGNKLLESIIRGWNNLMMFFIFLVNLWPFLLIIAAFVFWWMKRRNLKKTDNKV